MSRFPQARVQQGAQGELPADTHLQLQEGEECICGFIFFFFSWQLCLVCTYIRFLLFPLANGQINKQHNELYVLPETRMSILKNPYTGSPAAVPAGSPAGLPSGAAPGVPRRSERAVPDHSPAGVPRRSPAAVPAGAQAELRHGAEAGVPDHPPAAVPDRSSAAVQPGPQAELQTGKSIFSRAFLKTALTGFFIFLQVPKENCQQIPKYECQNVPVQQPSQNCRTVPKQQCQTVPRQQCSTVLFLKKTFLGGL